MTTHDSPPGPGSIWTETRAAVPTTEARLGRSLREFWRNRELVGAHRTGVPGALQADGARHRLGARHAGRARHARCSCCSTGSRTSTPRRAVRRCSSTSACCRGPSSRRRSRAAARSWSFESSVLNKVRCPREVFPVAAITVARLRLRPVGRSSSACSSSITGYEPHTTSFWVAVVPRDPDRVHAGVALGLSVIVVYPPRRRPGDPAAPAARAVRHAGRLRHRRHPACSGSRSTRR